MPIEVFARQVELTPNEVYLRQPINGQYSEQTWAEVYEQTLRLAKGLLGLGLKQGDRVAILANNCAEWFVADYALIAVGLVPTPIYATAGRDIISHVLSHSDSKAIFVGELPKPEVAEKNIPEGVISIGMTQCAFETDHSMAELISVNEPISETYSPSDDDMFSIVYTSGSTGLPKGVVLDYKNIASAGTTAASMLETEKPRRFLSYLPLAHVTERALVEYNSLYGAATVTFNESLGTFIRDLRSAKVTSFISVPRLWVKFQSQVLASIPQKKLDLMLRIPILSGIVKRKIQTQLGLNDVDLCGSGSAPISPSILEWYHRIGIEIAEGWGMTESMGMATTQFPYNMDKMGTIGKAVEGFEIKISDQGEILVRGDGVFKSYYKNPEATKDTFTEDGFLKTGDKAEMDSDGYLRITGRVKDLFKSGKGKYVAPVPIEGKIASNLLIEQLCVMGSGLPTAMVVVVLSEEVAKGMSKEDIEASLVETVQSVNKEIEKHEVVGGVRIAKEPWTVENGLLTPTLKVKRAELEAKYGDFVAMESDAPVVWES